MNLRRSRRSLNGIAPLVLGLLASSTVGLSYTPYDIPYDFSNDLEKGFVVPSEIDLGDVPLSQPGFVISGIGNSYSGKSISGAGDVNGDGIPDVIVGAPGTTGGSGDYGDTYVVFGSNSNAAIDLSNLGNRGFQILGDDTGTNSGSQVSGIGDFNGDGLGDILVGTPNADTIFADNAGAFYIVFGKSSITDVNLDSLGTGGIIFTGNTLNDRLGNGGVSAAGDVNGDGYSDIIVGSQYADSSTGEAFVIFGRGSYGTYSIGSINMHGFKIEGSALGQALGSSVSGAGDVNGDGLDDLVIGSRFEDSNGMNNNGAAYVVFGKSDNDTIDIGSFDSLDLGFRIDGVLDNQHVGRAVSGAGDINGDGLADIIIGAPYSGESPDEYGRSFVVFGKASSTAVDLTDPLTGFTIDLPDSDLGFGSSISGAGDMNGDGLADLIVGARTFSESPQRNRAGRSWIIPGQASNDPIDLSDENSTAISITGIDSYDYSGYGVASAGDMNGDGLSDILISSTDHTVNNEDYAGETYVVFSPYEPFELPTWKGWAKSGDAPPLALGDNGDGSNIFIPDSFVTIDFGDGFGFGESDASCVSVKRLDLDSDFDGTLPEGALPIGWDITTDREEWTEAKITFKYTDLLLDGQDEEKLYMYIQHPITFDFIQIPSTVDPDRNQISTTYNGLGLFVIAPDSTREVELSGLAGSGGGFTIHGILPGSGADISISGAGDVNGDGMPDLLVGAPQTYFNSLNRGAAFVVFGKTDSATVELTTLETNNEGFAIYGGVPLAHLGHSVSGAGDLNGDGLDDVVIGAYSSYDDALKSRPSTPGEAFVIFGKTDSSPIETDSAQLGNKGFRISGLDSNDLTGFSVSSAGDVNGDGTADVIIGAYGVNNNYTGAAYVIFGDEDNNTVDLNNLLGRGFSINGIISGGHLGESVSGAGDVNADGRDDLLICAPRELDDGFTGGVAYVMFGGFPGSTFDVTRITSEPGNGFKVSGLANNNAQLGRSSSGAGDVNGDGYDDIILSSRYRVPGSSYYGFRSSFVVFGSATPDHVEVPALGENGFRISGRTAYDGFGRSVSGAGDVNGDGLADLIIGTPYADGSNSPGNNETGGAIVVLGKQDFEVVNSRALGPKGFVINGINVGDYTGQVVSSAGDMNGDGLADLLVGSAFADGNRGETYLVFSPYDSASDPTWNGWARQGDAPKLAIGKNGDRSNVDTPDSRSWIDFEDGIGDGLSSASLVTSTRFNTNKGGGVSLPDNALPVYWELSTDRSFWSRAEVEFKYRDGDISTQDESRLALFHADSPDGPWRQLTTERDSKRNRVSAKNLSSLGFFSIAPDPTVVIELGTLQDDQGGFNISGGFSTNGYNDSISGIGDMNGDGLADMIIGSSSSKVLSDEYAGKSWVVYGKADYTTVSLNSPGEAAFTLEGVSMNDLLGAGVSGAGDVNGDGVADIIVGAYNADPSGVENAGEALVVFGKPNIDPINSNNISSVGFSIQGSDVHGYLGRAVSGAGDFNGDGLADLIVGEYYSNNRRGETYIVFGKADNSPVITDSFDFFDSQGIRIDGIISGDYSGHKVSGIGDVNCDGFDDILIGAYSAYDGANNENGASYVIFGSDDGQDLNLGTLGSRGFTITLEGTAFGGNLGVGASVSGAGDVNGDGVPDMIIGAYGFDYNGNQDSGAAFVVFGKDDIGTVDLGLMGDSGFLIGGAEEGKRVGSNVAGAGDFNGDGLGDLLIGSRNSNELESSLYGGTAYLVFGKYDNFPVNLGALGDEGIKFVGNDTFFEAGTSVAGGGDINGDGLADLLIEARVAGSPDAAVTLVAFSPYSTGGFPTWNNFIKEGDAPKLPIGITGDGSNDDTPDSRLWVDFVDGTSFGPDNASHMVVNRRLTNLKGLNQPPGTLNVLWEVRTDREQWTSADFTFKYLDSELEADGESNLVIYHGSSISGPWVQLPSIVDRNRNQIKATTTSGGFFLIAEDATPVIDPSEIGSTIPGINIPGVNNYDRVGRSVSGAGDVNGDGFADFIVSAPGYDSFSGVAFVVFGQPGNGTTIDLSNLTNFGFRIDGIGGSVNYSESVSGIGDINGDGLGDLLIGTPYSANGAATYAGGASVVFGKKDNVTVDLSALGSSGFKIQGMITDEEEGKSVSGAGDVNGDGVADLIIGNSFTNGISSGDATVIFGREDFTGIDIDNLGSDGFRIIAATNLSRLGHSVSGAGDVNGDGKDDLVVGAFRETYDGNNDVGAAYIIFGKSDSTDIDLSIPGLNGFAIYGADTFDLVGESVSGAGDVNGDGLADIIIGGSRTNPYGVNDAGTAYLILGKDDTNPILLSALGSSGFTINGSDERLYAGNSVSGAGDINGDGYADLVIGAEGFDFANESEEYSYGAVYVIAGSANPTDINLATTDSSLLRVEGNKKYDYLGISVAAVGDVNGDGFSDIIFGSTEKYPAYSGHAYVLFSPFGSGSSPSWKGWAKDGDAPSLALGSNGDGSNFDTHDSRFEIDFRDGFGTGVSNASEVNVTRNIIPARKSVIALPDAISTYWEASTDRENWTTATVTIDYLESELDGRFEQQLRLYHSDNFNGPFEELPTIVDVERNELTADVTGLGFFGIAAVNSVPRAFSSGITTNQNSTVRLDLNGDDLETAPENLIFKITRQPSVGTLNTNNLPEFIYTPPTDFVGEVTFEFVVNDGIVDSEPAEVSLIFQDRTNPTVMLSTDALNVTGVFEVTAEFSETVTGFVAEDLSVTNGVVSNFSNSIPLIFTFDVTPDQVGTVTIQVPGAVATDGSGNDNEASNIVEVEFNFVKDLWLLQ